jgi:hypothetical protein
MTAMAVSLTANAQLLSVDHGAAALDGHGLMWANVVGVNLGYYPPGGAGTGQGWVAGLNAAKYGGYNDWTFATGNGSFAPNTTTNQLGELFYGDCGNSAGIQTVMNKAGKNCTALSAVKNAVSNGTGGFPGDALFVANSGIGVIRPGYPVNFWAYFTPGSRQGVWDSDTVYNGVVGEGYALAVRSVHAPEIDPASEGSALTLLFGVLAVAHGRRRSENTAGGIQRPA